MDFARKYQYQIAVFITVVLGFFLFLELARDIQREGDFGGYVEAGRLAWEKQYIYSEHRNTWPPFMSLAAIPIHWLNGISFVGLRLTWLLGILITYWYIFRWTFSYFFQKRLVFKLSTKIESEIVLTSPQFIVPFLLTFRILIEEISNLQVNVTLLGVCIAVLILHLRGRYFWAGLLLALAISTKAYPLILFAFLLYKKEFKTSAYTALGLIVTYSAVIAYFGKGSSVLYIQWYTQQVAQGLQCIHFNQSLWSFVCGLFSETSRYGDFQFNIAELSLPQTKIISLVVIAFIGFFVAVRFYNTRNITNGFAVQWLIVLSFIPVFSPLAWKCYFVFLTPLVILLYKNLNNSRLIWLLYIPLFFITFTSELFIGNWLSDITESLGFITLSSLFISLFATYNLTKTTTLS